MSVSFGDELVKLMRQHGIKRIVPSAAIESEKGGRISGFTFEGAQTPPNSREPGGGHPKPCVVGHNDCDHLDVNGCSQGVLGPTNNSVCVLYKQRTASAR